MSQWHCPRHSAPASPESDGRGWVRVVLSPQVFLCAVRCRISATENQRRPRETHAQEWLRRTMTVSTSSRSNQPREMYSPSLRRADTRVAKEEGTHGRP